MDGGAVRKNYRMLVDGEENASKNFYHAYWDSELLAQHWRVAAKANGR